MSGSRRASWQLPPGVAPGTWDYVHSDSIAYDYDRYFTNHALFACDQRLNESWFPVVDPAQQIVVADLGCGTARGLEPLIARGYHGLAVDLSGQMLEVVEQKRTEKQWPVRRLRANLVELEGVRDECVDHAICLFSTLGMVKTQAARQRMLAHTYRILKPGGKFVVHVHGLWTNLLFPGGLRWIASSWWQSLRDKESEIGDKYYAYRGLTRMFLHVFRRREIVRAVTHAGFKINEVVPLNGNLSGALSRAWLLQSIRASGWVICGQKPAA